MSAKRVLVIEDDRAIRRGVVDVLQFAGFETREVGNGREGLNLALHTRYDLMLLDLVLPGVDGLDILRQVRKARPSVPVIIVSARSREGERIEGLRLGADDYVVKPFSVRELLARVEAVLRRTPGRPLDITEIDIGAGRVDLSRREIRFKNNTVSDLSEKEVEILRYLVQNAGRAVSREELLSSVWGLKVRGVTTRTIDMHLARLRAKLADDPRDPRILRTVRGKGYMYATPAPACASGEWSESTASPGEGDS